MNTERLREVVAGFYEVSAADLQHDFALNTPKRQGSVARYALDALIRRELGVQSRAVHTAKTYGELEAALSGTAPAPATAKARPLGLDGDVACGVDIEMVANMPEAGDYFEHTFYQSHFTKSEIAYATAQQHPRMHLAARWCAKEALKKCDPAFHDVAPNAIEVALDPEGKPHLRRANGEAPDRLPYALSLTHTPDMAAAVVVAVARRDKAAPPTTSTAAAPSATPPANTAGKLALLMAAGALAVAVLALIF